MKILLVEDQQFFRRNVVRYLKHLGHEVLEVTSGEEAIEIIASSDFNCDAVITDMNLGSGANGIMVLQALWATALKPAILHSSAAEGYHEGQRVDLADIVKNLADDGMDVEFRLKGNVGEYLKPFLDRINA